LTPIAINIEETFKFYKYIRGSTKEEALVDRDMGVKYWHHPPETITFLKENNEDTSTIQIFTDESESEHGVGAGIVIFKSGNLIDSLKYRLNKRCTDNQAEQLAIFRALEYTGNIEREDKTDTKYTDSRMTQDSLKNSNIHTFLIEEIRRKVEEMDKINWKIQFCWVKALAGIQGNELADTLAEEAATNADIIECYKKVAKSVVLIELGRISVEKWQREWDQTTNGTITKEYCPVVDDRLKMKINITQNFTTMVTRHGNMRSYLHRFKIIETPVCPCGNRSLVI
jgi:ribonuclease HI